MTTPLAELRDRVPPLPFPEVRAAVERELGAPLETLFSEFDPEPLGAASIAQVHRARLPGVDAVAVKVQYPGSGPRCPPTRVSGPWLRRVLRAAAAAVDRDRLVEFAAGLRGSSISPARPGAGDPA